MRRTNNARRGLGIRGQLMFFLCFICLFLLVLFWILSTQLLEPLYTRHIERQLTTQAENVVSQLDDALAEGTTLSSWSFGRLYVNAGFFDKLAGLEGGADDYVVKPFSPRELVARVKAVLNRTMPRSEASDGTMTFGELTIDTASHTVRVAGEDVSLTPKEFDLLVFLASNKGIALSREKILQKVWNYDYFGEDRTVDTHVKMLRGHLGKCRGYIATVWGIGYKFDPDAAR